MGPPYPACDDHRRRRSATGSKRAVGEKENKTGITTFVMRGKEYVVALRAREDLLVPHTLPGRRGPPPAWTPPGS